MDYSTTAGHEEINRRKENSDLITNTDELTFERVAVNTTEQTERANAAAYIKSSNILASRALENELKEVWEH